MNEPMTVPESRIAPLRRILQSMAGAQRCVLTTHVNADGDGAGSEAAVAAWLAGLGKEVHIVNPTPYPDVFRFLVEDVAIIADAGTAAAERAFGTADLLIVLDTAEASRIGRVAKAARGRDVIVIDHHPPTETSLAGECMQDPSACATGELIFDLLLLAGLPRPWPQQVRNGIYTAVVTDTGSFRFSNTTRRTHAVAGDLIEQGVDPELMFRHIYATVPLRRIELLRHALEQLDVDAAYPITAITISRGVMERLGATSDDLDGVIDHARSIEGTEVAILFRETADGSTKVSLRSAGAVDVNAIARQFGGGGHVKASGALIADRLDTVRPRVLQATRAALQDAGLAFRRASAAP
ncbi:MAG TPA: bifunctional oligoribonuclease/PAP phosphatase NrnA [Longimicrobiales bacterium]|nr:bifunctional oligoribonuclease/PAP phosphatase NrnA [Longimicrobiales bacterium]